MTVVLSASPEQGIKCVDTSFNPPKVIMSNSVYEIAHCGCDVSKPRIFTCLVGTKGSDALFFCHVFKCDTKETAMKVTRAVAAACTQAYQEHQRKKAAASSRPQPSPSASFGFLLFWGVGQPLRTPAAHLIFSLFSSGSQASPGPSADIRRMRQDAYRRQVCWNPGSSYTIVDIFSLFCPRATSVSRAVDEGAPDRQAQAHGWLLGHAAPRRSTKSFNLTPPPLPLLLFIHSSANRTLGSARPWVAARSTRFCRTPKSATSLSGACEQRTTHSAAVLLRSCFLMRVLLHVASCSESQSKPGDYAISVQTGNNIWTGLIAQMESGVWGGEL